MELSRDNSPFSQPLTELPLAGAVGPEDVRRSKTQLVLRKLTV